MQAQVVPIPTVLAESEVERYRGDLLANLGHSKEAEKHFEAALQARGDMAEAHAALGAVRLRQSRLTEAESYTRRAVELAPDLYRAHLILGAVLDESGRCEEAARHLERAVQLKPGVARDYALLSLAQDGCGQKQAALASLRQALKLDPSMQEWLWERVYRALLMHRSNIAAADAMTFLKSRGWHTEQSPYFALSSCMASLQAGRPTEADGVAKEGLAQLDPKRWPYPVFQYLAGQLTEEQMLKRATDNHQLTEAHAYLGLHLLFSANQDGAIPHLRWVQEKGVDYVVEFELAVAELARSRRSHGSWLRQMPASEQGQHLSGVVLDAGLDCQERFVMSTKQN
jgi:tetratricopeptide (TPR) repeat protein